ncbi:MAG: hypothetical protein ABI840_00650 [bacterium]
MKKKFLRQIDRKFKYRNLFRPSIGYPDNKFVIYTRGRTGSTVLTELLNCHPDIFCDVEIFNFLYSNSIIRFPHLYINSCSKTATLNRKPVYGFKVKIAQLRHEHEYKDYEKILQRLSNEGWKFLHLKRKNFLRHKLSNLVMAETNISHIQKNDNFKPKKILLDCSVLMEGILSGEEVEKTEEKNLQGIPNIKIYYENDLLDNTKHQETADRIFDYLNLKTHKVKTNLKRISSENLEEMISNYDEVYNFFKDTKYSEFLK